MRYKIVIDNILQSRFQVRLCPNEGGKKRTHLQVRNALDKARYCELRLGLLRSCPEAILEEVVRRRALRGPRLTRGRAFVDTFGRSAHTLRPLFAPGGGSQDRRGAPPVTGGSARARVHEATLIGRGVE